MGQTSDLNICKYEAKHLTDNEFNILGIRVWVIIEMDFLYLPKTLVEVQVDKIASIITG